MKLPLLPGQFVVFGLLFSGQVVPLWEGAERVRDKDQGPRDTGHTAWRVGLVLPFFPEFD